MFITLAGLAGLVFGALIYRALQDGIMLAQEAAHKTQMDELFTELKRARAQVANLIGKE